MKVFVFFILSLGCFVSLELKASVELQPHRAYYTVTLQGHPNPQSSITDVNGTMLIEFEKVCSGWTTQERSEIRFYHDDGSVENNRWGYVTFEAEDGSFFQFSAYRKVDGDLLENIQGQATRKGETIEVAYKNPKKTILTLSEETFFPTQHIKALLEAAQKEEHIFSCLVFDGSSDVGASEINTFIGAKKVMAGNPISETAHQLANQPFWPVRFAVYGQKKIEYSPLYTTSQDLLPNGIIKHYVIDYGGFKVRGTLDRIELLRADGC